MNPRVLAAVLVAVPLATTGLVEVWEGYEEEPYRDIVGVWTVCGGVTGPRVIPGKRYSRRECRWLTGEAVEEHARGLAACITANPPPPKTAAAFISWTYNVGVDAACKSTLIRMWNDGDLVGACNQLPRWNRAGGRVVPGLANRRSAELPWCLEGLNEP